MYIFPSTKIKVTRKSVVCVTSQFAPAKDFLFFVLVKLALLAGPILVDGSSPVFIFGAVNTTRNNLPVEHRRIYNCFPGF